MGSINPVWNACFGGAELNKEAIIMSQQVVLFALLTVAPGKWDRFDELFVDALDFMRKDEPGEC